MSETRSSCISAETAIRYTERSRPTSAAATRYKVLRILYGWLEEEEETDANPMARMKPPIVPEQPVPVVPETACGGCLPSAPVRALSPPGHSHHHAAAGHRRPQR